MFLIYPSYIYVDMPTRDVIKTQESADFQTACNDPFKAEAETLLVIKHMTFLVLGSTSLAPTVLLTPLCRHCVVNMGVCFSTAVH